MTRRLLALAALALATATLAVPAAQASPYPPGGATVVASSGTTKPGQPITLTAQNFCPGSTVEFRLVGPAPSTDSVLLGTVVADSEGVAVLQIDAPAVQGTYTVVATSNGPGRPCAQSTETEIRVSLAPTPGTGSDTGRLLTAGGVVLLVGACLLAVARIRRRSGATPAAA